MPIRDITATIPADFHDAFGRLRTSNTGQRLDVEFIYDKQPAFMDEVTNSGTVTFNTNSRDLTLALANATAGSFATMRSHPVPYTPGNSQLIDMTGVLDFSGIGGGVAQTFLRSSVTGSVVETVTDQASWSEETVPGIDWSTSHIFAIDFQSLKVGTIRYYLVRDGVPTVVHVQHNDGLYGTGYWQLPSLPVYWRIYNDATYTYMELGYGDEANAVGFRYRISANAAATMKAICCTVKSEGGDSLRVLGGVPFATNMAATAKTVSTTRIPLISIRSKALFNAVPNLGILLPKSFGLQASHSVRVDLIFNGTLTGASWADVDPLSTAEVDTTASAVAGGQLVLSDYVAAAKDVAGAGQGILGREVIWDRLGSPSGILTVAAIRTSGTDASCLASMGWEEIR